MKSPSLRLARQYNRLPAELEQLQWLIDFANVQQQRPRGAASAVLQRGCPTLWHRGCCLYRRRPRLHRLARLSNQRSLLQMHEGPVTSARVRCFRSKITSHAASRSSSGSGRFGS